MYSVSKVLSACALSALVIGAQTAQAAKQCVDFDDLVLGTPYNVPFVSGGVNINVLQVNNTVGDSCNGQMLFGGVTVMPALNACSGNGSKPNELIIDSVLLDFNMADFIGGNPAKKLSFKYAIVIPNVEIVINGQCFVRPSFTALPNGVYGGVKYKATNCKVTLKKKTAAITGFAVGAEVMYLDDVCVKG